MRGVKIEELKLKHKTPVCFYYGGKFIHLNKLLPLAPEHKYYCEVFGGMANFLFFKNPVGFEVYNDINSDFVNFFRVLRDEEKFEKFSVKVNLTPYSRGEFSFLKDKYEEVTDEVERAYIFYILMNMSFNGLRKTWAYSIKQIRRNMSGCVSKFLSKIDNLPYFHSRLQRVQVEHLDWKEICNKYNVWGSEGFFYLDPPYFPSTLCANSYDFILSIEEHWKLVIWLLRSCKVKVLLSGYENEAYKLLENEGWKKERWDTVTSAALRKGEKQSKRVECVWYNYDLKEEKEK